MVGRPWRVCPSRPAPSIRYTALSLFPARASCDLLLAMRRGLAFRGSTPSPRRSWATSVHCAGRRVAPCGHRARRSCWPSLAASSCRIPVGAGTVCLKYTKKVWGGRALKMGLAPTISRRALEETRCRALLVIPSASWSACPTEADYDGRLSISRQTCDILAWSVGLAMAPGRTLRRRIDGRRHARRRPWRRCASNCRRCVLSAAVRKPFSMDITRCFAVPAFRLPRLSYFHSCARPRGQAEANWVCFLKPCPFERKPGLHTGVLDVTCTNGRPLGRPWRPRSIGPASARRAGTSDDPLDTLALRWIRGLPMCG